MTGLSSVDAAYDSEMDKPKDNKSCTKCGEYVYGATLHNQAAVELDSSHDDKECWEEIAANSCFSDGRSIALNQRDRLFSRCFAPAFASKSLWIFGDAIGTESTSAGLALSNTVDSLMVKTPHVEPAYSCEFKIRELQVCRMGRESDTHPT